MGIDLKFASNSKFRKNNKSLCEQKYDHCAKIPSASTATVQATANRSHLLLMQS